MKRGEDWTRIIPSDECTVLQQDEDHDQAKYKRSHMSIEKKMPDDEVGDLQR